MTATTVTTTATPGPRATYRDVLVQPIFRLLFATRTLGVAADSLRITTLSVLIYATTGSPLLGALAFGAGFLPQLIGSLALGALADRGRPRRLIVAGHLLPAVVAAAPALVRLPVGATLALIGAVSCLAPVFGGAGTRLVTATLTGDAYVLGRSLTQMAASGAQLVGLAGAGVAVTVLGARGALLVSAAGYLAAAVAVRLGLPDLPPPGLPESSGTTGAASSATPQAVRQAARSASARRRMRGVLRGSWAGTGALLAERRVRALLLAQWLPPAFAAGAEGLIVPFTGQSALPSGAAALLLGALPVGMLLGDLLVGRLVRPATRERLVAPLAALLGLPLLGFALSPGLLVCVLLLLTAGTGFAYPLGLQRRFLDALPSGNRGQAFGLLSAGLMTVQGLGPVLFGLLAQLTSAGHAMACAGLAVVVTAAWLASWARR